MSELRIICEFNQEYEIFLKSLFDYVVTQYGKDLNLSELHTIEIVRELPNGSDGRMIDKNTINLSSRLYVQLPILEIHKLHDNDVYQIIVRTLFHELCHISEVLIMPNIHQDAFSQSGTILEYMVRHFWIEYIAQTKTCVIFGQGSDEVHVGFANKKWGISKVNFDDNDYQNYFYLSKLLAYVIPRVRSTDSMNTYLKSIRNPIVKSMVFELDDETSRLDALYPFDGIEPLCEVRRLFEVYWHFFIRKKPFENAYHEK